MNTYKNITDMIEYPKEGIISKKLVKEGILEATLFCMAKDTEISDHTSTKDGVVYVAEGKGEFMLEGKKIEMVPGMMIYMRKDAVHSLKAYENTSFVLYLWKQ